MGAVYRTDSIRKWVIFCLFPFRLWNSELYPAVSVPLTTRQSLLYLVVGDSNELFLLWRPVLLLPFSSLTSLNVFIINCLDQFTVQLRLRPRLSVTRYSGLICWGFILAIFWWEFCFFAEFRLKFPPSFGWFLNFVQTANVSILNCKRPFKQSPKWKQKYWHWELHWKTAY